MLSKIHNLLNFCYSNNSKDKIPSIELQLFLISVKCLIPYENDIGCFFDIERYNKEIDLFKYYKNGRDEVLEYFYEERKLSEKYDELLENRIISIIIANTQWDIILNETINTILAYSNNHSSIIDTIIISSIINEYLYSNADSILETTKTRLISFSVKDLFIRNNITCTNKSLIIFEKERIKILSNLEKHIDELKNRFKSLHYIYNEEKSELDLNEESVLYNFSVYLNKLRKGIISPEKLKVTIDNIPDIKEFLKYQDFNHPLLGRTRVLKRGEKDVILINKAGLIKVNI